MPVINHIHSATTVVHDQDRVVDFYVNMLGFEKRRDDSFMPESRWIEVVPPNTSTALALITPRPSPDTDRRRRVTKPTSRW